MLPKAGRGRMLRAYLLFIGVSSLSCGAWLALRLLEQRKRSLRATGQIVGVVSQTDQNEQTYYFARIAFCERDGTHVEFVSRVGNADAPPLGQNLAILYDPQKPADAAEAAFAAQWGFPLTIFFLGALSTALALFSPLI